MLKREDLHPYQERGVRFIHEKMRCGLFLDMGLGKTATTLTAMADMIDACVVKRVLAICPLRVANSVWRQEAAQWQHLKHLRVSVCTGSEKDRLAGLKRKADVYVINRENTQWLVDECKKTRKWPFDALVIDESSSFKSHSAKRFKKLKLVLDHVHVVVLLTGTPAPNGIHDLWSQIFLLDRGKTLGKTVTSYRQRFFDQDYFGYRWTPKEGSAEVVQNLINPLILSMSAADYLQLPERIDITERVTLPGQVLDMYNEFAKELVIALTDGEELEAVSAAVLANKLLQFCISEYTLVLTNRGWIEIKNITDSDFIWDGTDWVNCGGSIFKGYKPTIECFGVDMTPEHKVLTKSGWMTAKEINYGKSCKKSIRAKVRLPHNHSVCWKRQIWMRSVGSKMRLWKNSNTEKPKFEGEKQTSKKIMWMQTRRSHCFGKGVSWKNGNKRVDYLVKHEIKMQLPRRQRLQKLRRSWHNRLQKMGQKFFGILERYERWIRTKFNNRKNRQLKRLFKTKLQVGNCRRAIEQYQGKYTDRHTKGQIDNSASCQNIWNKKRNSTPKNKVGMEYGTSVNTPNKKVYDIINCGPKHRFVVKDKNGEPLVVHNCNGAVYTDDKRNWSVVHNAKLDALAEIIEDNPGENIIVVYNFQSDLARLKAKFPSAVPLTKQPNVIDRWNRGEIKLLLAHPASCGHGINLQYGGSVIIWFGLNWSLELYQQMNARICRQGQTKPVRVIHIIAEDTIDWRVMGVIKSKDAVQADLLEALKNELYE